jgi:hypothetical protein
MDLDTQVRSLFTCCAPPTTPFICLPRASIPYFLYSRAARPHQQPTTSGESQNDKHDLRVSAFVDAACSLVHFRLILPLCAYLIAPGLKCPPQAYPVRKHREPEIEHNPLKVFVRRFVQCGLRHVCSVNVTNFPYFIRCFKTASLSQGHSILTLTNKAFNIKQIVIALIDRLAALRRVKRRVKILRRPKGKKMRLPVVWLKKSNTKRPRPEKMVQTMSCPLDRKRTRGGHHPRMRPLPVFQIRN